MAHIRKAKETDRSAVALCIAEGFEKDFSGVIFKMCSENDT